MLIDGNGSHRDGSAIRLLAYLRRYTRRVASTASWFARLLAVGSLSLARLPAHYTRAGESKITMLAADELIRCFVLHAMTNGSTVISVRYSKDNHQVFYIHLKKLNAGGGDNGNERK